MITAAKGRHPASSDRPLRAWRRAGAVAPVAALLVVLGCRGGGDPAGGPPPLPRAEAPAPRPATAEDVLAAVRDAEAGVVLVNVWATWCIPCREEMPDLLAVRREFLGRGFDLLLVSTDFEEDVPAAVEFLSEQGVDFPTLLKQQADMPFIDALSARWSGALPASFLFNSTAELLWFREGKVSRDELRELVSNALAIGAADGPKG